MVLKYISILVLASGVIVWSMIGVAKLKAASSVASVSGNVTSNGEVAKVPVVPTDVSNVSQSAILSAAPASTKDPVISNSDQPKTLKIAKIGLTTGIESVGLDSAKRMDVPKNWQDVGWYNLGYPIGGSGNAVIDGHLDTVTGAPAAFYRIGNLVPGDLVTVLTESGKSYNFKVVSKQAYAFDKMPLQEIFATGGTSGLNLITCAGTWDKGSHNYLQRIVVYTKME